jgi:hypothetical protein
MTWCVINEGQRQLYLPYRPVHWLGSVLESPRPINSMTLPVHHPLIILTSHVLEHRCEERRKTNVTSKTPETLGTAHRSDSCSRNHHIRHNHREELRIINTLKFWQLPRNTFPSTNLPSCVHSVKSGVVCRSVGQLNCLWSSPAKSLLASALVENCEQRFCSLLDMYVFRSGTFRRKEGSVFLSRRCVCCTAVSSLTAKFLLALASIVVLDSESEGTHDLILRCGGSETALNYRWLPLGEGCTDNTSFIVHPCAEPLCISSYWISSPVVFAPAGFLKRYVSCCEFAVPRPWHLLIPLYTTQKSPRKIHNCHPFSRHNHPACPLSCTSSCHRAT